MDKDKAEELFHAHYNNYIQKTIRDNNDNELYVIYKIEINESNNDHEVICFVEKPENSDWHYYDDPLYKYHSLNLLYIIESCIIS